MFKTFYSTSDWRNDQFSFNIGCSESKVILKRRKKANISNKNALQGANIRASCISLRTPATNKHSQHGEKRKARLEPAIRDAQKLAQNQGSGNDIAEATSCHGHGESWQWPACKVNGEKYCWSMVRDSSLCRDLNFKSQWQRECYLCSKVR